jgi:hypothetical protein
MNRYHTRKNLQGALDRVRQAAHDHTLSRYEELAREAAFCALVDVAEASGTIDAAEARRWLECANYDPEDEEKLSPYEVAKASAKAWVEAA